MLCLNTTNLAYKRKTMNILWPDWRTHFHVPTVGDSVNTQSFELVVSELAPRDGSFKVTFEPANSANRVSTQGESIRDLVTDLRPRTASLIDKHINQGTNNQLHPSTRIELKAILENYRSILDYLAHFISTACDPIPKRKEIHFPIASFSEGENTFKKKLRKVYPRLHKNSPEIFEILMKVQHFSEGAWLRSLADLTNSSKHHSLHESEAVNYKSALLSFQNVGIRFGELGLDSVQMDSGGSI